MKVLRLAAPPRPSGGYLSRAMRAVSRATLDRPDMIVADLAGGQAAFVGFAPVITLASSSPAASAKSALANWLERRQARRSMLIFATDRPAAVAIALRWGLDPTRFRLMHGAAPSDEEIARDIDGIRSSKRTWHSA